MNKNRDLSARSAIWICMGMAALSGGCAGTSQSQPSAQPPDAQPEHFSLVINAGAGRFQEFTREYRIAAGETDKSVLRVKFRKLNPSDEWASLLKVCLEGSDINKDRACLDLNVGKDRTTIVPQAEEWVGSSENRSPVRKTLSPRYRVQDELLIRLDTSFTLVRFSINGEQQFESQAAVGPVNLVFFCSSAICSFDALE